TKPGGHPPRLPPLGELPGRGLLRLSGDGLGAANHADEGRGMWALAGGRAGWIELACSAALACFAALRWTELLAEPPSGRVTFAVLLATAAGAALVAIGGLGGGRAGGRVSRGARARR